MMESILLDEIARIVGAAADRIVSSAAVDDVCVDSRLARSGSLFFALPGARADGHDFVQDVLRAGGSAVVERGRVAPPAGGRVLEVDSPLKALHALAAFYLAKHRVKTAAVTGSMGKTTTKDFCAAVLSQRFHVHKTDGNRNTDIGVPLTVFGLDSSHDAVVFELGMRHSGEIRQLAHLVRPDVAVVTNVGPVHLETMGTIENIAAAKAEILEGLTPDGCAVLNNDDPRIATWMPIRAAQTLAYGLGADCDLRAVDVGEDSDGKAEFTARWRSEAVRVRLPIPGVHNIHNALAALGVGVWFGVPFSAACRGLEKAVFSGMRLQVEETCCGVTLINDCYNSNPQSAAAALDIIKGMDNHRRRVLVLGDMLELGDSAYASHVELGRSCAQAGDRLLFVGAWGDAVREGALDEGMASSAVTLVEDSETAARLAVDLVHAGDVVLLKGSRGVSLETVAAALHKKEAGDGS